MYKKIKNRELKNKSSLFFYIFIDKELNRLYNTEK